MTAMIRAEGWEQKTLGEVGTVHCGQSPPSAEVNREGVGVPYVSGPEQWDGFRLHLDKWTTAPKREAPAGCIFITVKGAGVGKLFPGTEAAIGRDIYAYEPGPGLTQRYVLHALRWTIEDLKRHAAGDIPGLTKSDILEHPIVVPPKDDQSRVAEMIDALFSRLDSAVGNLQRFQSNLLRYRASIIQIASKGRLVPTDAELARQEGRDYEPAKVLLEQILAERRAHWEAEELQKMGAKGEKPKEDKWKEKYSEPKRPKTSELPELPEGWAWATPEQLADWRCSNSLAIGPFGSNLLVRDYREAGVPLVFVRHIRSGQFSGMNDQFITPGKAEELRSHRVLPGDVLITKMGDPPGEAAVYPEGRPAAVITADCVRLSLADKAGIPKFFVYAIHSQLVQDQIKAITRGVAQKKISLGRFRGIALPLAPLAEQKRIVAEIERHLSLATELEATGTVALRKAVSFRAGVLQRAFEGRSRSNSSD